MISIGKIGFIGGGNMGEALIKGLIEGAFPAADILVAEPVEDRRLQLVERYGIDARADVAEVVTASEVVVLAIKPQIVPLVMPGIAKALDQKKLLVSIAAGVTSQTLEEYLNGSPRVIRVMPNTPALVGAGATAICRGSHAGEDDLLTARQLFEAVGIVQVVSEGQMDAVTGLSGSGPAYVYTVIEAMAAGGVQQGLTMDAALELAAQTVFGAAKLVMESGEHPAVLRDKVCSPGGTTIEAVKTLEKKGLRAALMEAVSRAAQRSRELGRK
ncbi:pyrroline-5-carboxylate reductase [Syntrophotalea acetylenivorans]|uniref:Pyrroline-5-carboxylate reductase n=1 Tax=Syntrophotalea acetylenivorans TaxID=1842532 RepID=A0A1L3GPJ0_9BACT|nr:pyrroline-5-carboxylate reductase [Syntrophotalea acetylenivorans]APG27856.1 pyrroline-5-carboxylate reductase [Syntrophotalea acetylenivorans]